MEQRLIELWYQDAAAPSLLQPLSWLYGAVSTARRNAYASGWLRMQEVGKPVIVVGNLTVGGTGKTPLVAWLAARLGEQGYRVGIVSRGYARERGAHAVARFVEPDSRWTEVGDEPLLLRRRTGCATVVARDRVAGARALVAQGVDVVVADDGLQHLRLARACEIVVVDGARGFGNGRLLPAGPLREAVSRLAAADLVVINGAADHPSLVKAGPQLLACALQMSLNAHEAHRVCDGVRRPLEAFRGQRVHAVAGIGNPARFFRDLRTRGIEVIEHAFADHHPFAARELDFADELPVLMTEKDAVKCSGFANPRLWYVPVEAAFGEAHARELLDQVVRRIRSPQVSEVSR
jgi:tetraacyldisaccharide 4'-kinase